MLAAQMRVFCWAGIIIERVNRGGDWLTFKVSLQGSLPRVCDRHRGHKCFGVIMSGVFEDLLARADLDNPPQIHDRNVMADALNHGHIVADKEHRDAELGLQL